MFLPTLAAVTARSREAKQHSNKERVHASNLSMNCGRGSGYFAAGSPRFCEPEIISQSAFELAIGAYDIMICGFCFGAVLTVFLRAVALRSSFYASHNDETFTDDLVPVHGSR